MESQLVKHWKIQPGGEQPYSPSLATRLGYTTREVNQILYVSGPFENDCAPYQHESP